MKDVYKDIAKQGIKVVYEPEVMEPIPKPTKAYEITVQRNIPENWVVGELDWHGPGIILGLYGNYLLEADSKRLQRAVISLTRRFTNYTEKRVAIQEQHRIY